MSIESFPETLQAWFLKTLSTNFPLERLRDLFPIKKGEVSFAGLKKAQYRDPVAIRMWFFKELDYSLDSGVAMAMMDAVTNLAKNWHNSQEKSEGDESIDKESLVSGLSEYMVAVAFGSKLKLAVWSLEDAKELRVLDKPEEAMAAMPKARARRFSQWFSSQFSDRNLPRMDVFFKQGFSFSSPPPVSSWLGQDKMENDLTGLLHEAGHSIPSESVASVSWDLDTPCFFNPVERELIPVVNLQGKIKLATRRDGSAYDLETVPEAWEAWESRINPDCRRFWRAQIFSIFAPAGLRSRMVIWGRSPGGRGQSSVQNVISKRVGSEHYQSFDQDSWTKGGWRFGSADVWNKSLVLTADVKGEGTGILRGSIVHQFTGSDIMTIQPKFGRIFSARCWGKIWVTSNEFPNIEVGAPHAMERLAMFEFGEMPEDILDRESVKDENGKVLLTKSGGRYFRTDFEKRLEEQFDDYLAICFKAWYEETLKMTTAPSKHPTYMLRRILSACGSAAQVAVEYKFDEYFECGSECEMAYSDLNFVLKAWNKNNATMKYEVPGFVKWAEALLMNRKGSDIFVDYRKGVHSVVGILFKGTITENRGRVAVTFPDSEKTVELLG